MKVINTQAQEQYEQRMAALKEQHAKIEKEIEEQSPKPITLKKHPEGSEPKKLGNGVVVMAGDYYAEGDNPFAVSAQEVGKGKTWAPA